MLKVPALAYILDIIEFYRYRSSVPDLTLPTLTDWPIQIFLGACGQEIGMAEPLLPEAALMLSYRVATDSSLMQRAV